VDSLVAEGNRLLEVGDLQGARADFERALQLEDQHAGAHLGRGRVFYALNQNQASVVELDQAVFLAPDWGHAWAWRGWVRYNRLGMVDMGIQDFQSGCERKDGWACQSMRDASDEAIGVGVSAYGQGDFTSALAYFDRAVSIDPTYPDGWYNRGLTRLALNDLSGGIEDLQAFIRHSENYSTYARARPLPPIQADEVGVAEAWARVGIAQFQMNQYDQALRSLAQAGYVAGQANPSAIPRYQHWAGRVLEAQGDRERAYEMYNQACGGGETQACADRDRLGGRHP
jgi:tetratricopeptide (TPR) repeat protein